jgi:adenine-specific DNA-methyltransferase
MSRKPRLELTWIGKDERPQLEPRILIEEPSKSYHAAVRSSGDIFDNMLLRGDNLLALKALEGDYINRVKCIFIDPPYNTGSAFAQYDDGLEHSLWLSMMRDRLTLLQSLLATDGSIWISIDDNEAHYLKVLLDEIFDRRNFVANVLWQKRTSPEARVPLGAAHDHILVYAKDAAEFSLAKLSLNPEDFANPDDDARGPWASTDFTAQGFRKNQMYKITLPSGREVGPPESRCWGNVEPAFKALLTDNRIWFGINGDARPRVKKFFSELKGKSAWTWWPNKEVGHNQEAKKESIALFGADAFATPKPERLLARIIELASEKGDLILDSFAGSGTTGAVAHKMGRRWIMVELGEHCDTHIAPRMRRVIDGIDPGGISETVGWKGGGGFRYYHLAPSLIDTDRWGNRVISKKYNPAMLAEAMCKHLGFTYAPSSDPHEYWLHGYSSERDFIYVTTASLTAAALRGISQDIGPDRTLLVCCKAFDAKADAFDNLTLKKIPQAVLATCEWGRDDYSLRIAQLPEREEEAEPADTTPKLKKARGKPADDGPSLFDKDT